MKKIINGRQYNTETAKAIGEFEPNPYRSDFSWYCETLYQKKTGEFFLHGVGNAASKYSASCGLHEWCPSERITPFTLDQAREWTENHLDADVYISLFGVSDSVSAIKEIEIYTDEEKAFISKHHLLSLEIDEEPEAIYWRLLYLMAHYRTLSYYRQFPPDTIVEPIAQSSWCDLTCTVSDKIKELVDDITEFEERGYLYA